jgi:hypothetical protein
MALSSLVMLVSSSGICRRFRNIQLLSMCGYGSVWEGGAGEDLEVIRAADYTGEGSSSSSCSSTRQT